MSLSPNCYFSPQNSRSPKWKTNSQDKISFETIFHLCVNVCYLCVCVPGCSRSCTRTTETLCRCNMEAPSWSTGSRPTARLLPGHNTQKTSCKHCHATTAMLSQVCYVDECRSLLIPPSFWFYVIQKSIHKYKLHLMRPLQTFIVDNKPHVLCPGNIQTHFFPWRAYWEANEANIHCIVLFFSKWLTFYAKCHSACRQQC